MPTPTPANRDLPDYLFGAARTKHGRNLSGYRLKRNDRAQYWYEHARIEGQVHVDDVDWESVPGIERQDEVRSEATPEEQLYVAARSMELATGLVAPAQQRVLGIRYPLTQLRHALWRWEDANPKRKEELGAALNRECEQAEAARKEGE